MPDNHDARSLTPVKETFDTLLSKHGFKTEVYGASRRYIRTVPKVTHEVSIRLMTPSVYQVEMGVIKDTPSGRKVTSKSTKGCLNTCLKFVQQEYPSDANQTVSHASAS